VPESVHDAGDRIAAGFEGVKGQKSFELTFDEFGFVAVELELTTKSSRRYREILLHYRLSSKFTKILYISNDKSTFRKMQKELLGYTPRGADFVRKIDPFTFLLTSELECSATRKEILATLFKNYNLNNQEVRA
jgi:hypothetical protein